MCGEGLHMKVSKKNIYILLENISIILIFAISLINNSTMIMAILISFILLVQNEKGVLKLILLFSLRFLISPGLDTVDKSIIIQLMKYFSIYVLGTIYVLRKINILMSISIWRKFIISTSIMMILFMLISSISSLNHFISYLKILNYIIPLSIIVSLLFLVEDKRRIFIWISTFYKYIILFTFPFIYFPLGYLLNGFSLQGILNQPNLLGVLLVLGLVIILSEFIYSKKYRLFNFIIFLMGITELFLTNSRTSLGSMIICMLIIFMTLNFSIIKKIIVLICLSVITFITINIPIINSYLVEFIVKGQSSNQILYSRYGQIENVKYILDEYPLLGIGFGIPLNRTALDINDYTFEAGNILFGVIIFSGIIGALCYIFYLLYIFNLNIKNKNNIVFFIATLLVNFGEMIMFSTNNAGLFCYMSWALYLQNSNELYI